MVISWDFNGDLMGYSWNYDGLLWCKKWFNDGMICWDNDRIYRIILGY